MRVFLMTVAALGVSLLMMSDTAEAGRRHHRRGGNCGCGSSYYDGGSNGGYYGGGYGAYAEAAPSQRAYSYEPGTSANYMPVEPAPGSPSFNESRIRRANPWEYSRDDQRRYSGESR